MRIQTIGAVAAAVLASTSLAFASGPATKDARVTYAFGHGHLGLTQSAATARLVADIIAGRPPKLDLTPFRPQRFGSTASLHSGKMP